MNALLQLLIDNPLLLLFTVIGLGYLLGNIRIGGFQLGVAAVLFVGMAFGALDTRLDLPEYIYVIGLVFFVYAMGLQSGSGFFASFRKRGLKINLLAMLLLVGGGLCTVAIWRLMGLSGPSAVGLFCGALTNTPALAATVETVKNFSGNVSTEASQIFINSPVVTYGLAYPFGVLGVILWIFVTSKFWKVNFKDEAKSMAADDILSWTFTVTNPAINGKSVGAVLKLLADPGFVLSRIRSGSMVSIVTSDTVLSAGDQVVAVGTATALEKAVLLFGKRSEEDISLVDTHDDEFAYRRVFVSKKEVAGKTIAELNLQQTLHATVTRIRRGDVDFVPSGETVLELGDRIRVVTRRENIEKVTEFFGDSVKGISETDFLSLSLGIVLGVFAGMIEIPLPNGSSFKLGFAGGPLIVALILGRLERTGPISWSLPFSANLVLRQIGLVFFLAAIGTKAGHGFMSTFQTGGIGLIAGGAVITTFVSLSTILIAFKVLRLPMSAVMGMVSGMHTQPAVLAYANQQAQNEIPNIWYATVYPASMITKIFLAQIIVSLLMML